MLKPDSNRTETYHHSIGIETLMVVSGSPKTWDRWHIISQLAVKMPLIYHLYIASWGVICYLPPFRGTKNNH